MPGIDDYGADETFTEADATTVLNWAQPTWYFSNTFEPFTSGSGGGGGTTINGNYSGLCLSVSGGATAPKSSVDIYTCNGSASENWTVG
jgi:hypothetical protein